MTARILRFLRRGELAEEKDADNEDDYNDRDDYAPLPLVQMSFGTDLTSELLAPDPLKICV
jgi:hypothetical protein